MEHHLIDALRILSPLVHTDAGDVSMGNSGICVVNKDAGEATEVTLTGRAKAGYFAFVKDGKRDAATNNITIVPDGTTNNTTIDGAANLVISENGGAVLLMHNGSEWNQIVHPIPGVAELAFLNGIVAGTVAASKALVVDANKDLASLRHLTLTGNLTIGATALTEALLGVLFGVTPGTAAASKALVTDASNRLGTVAELAVTTPIVGQVAPEAKAGVATIAIADILKGIVTLEHATGGTVALTLDTGTDMDTGKPNKLGTDQAIDWYLINLSAAAADTGTLTASAGHTIVGEPVVQSAHVSTGGVMGNAAHFRSRRTAANTWVTYRIG